MAIHHNKIHSNFKLNGKPYTFEALKILSQEFLKSDTTFKNHIGEFLSDWLNDSDAISLKTSGSTGKPKVIELSKQKMINSALATKAYFNLQSGDRALLCLPAHYIAGKMMLVRALVIGLDLDCIEPKSELKIDQSIAYNFSAMVPLQLQANINKISNIKILIIGGAKVSEDLISNIQHLKTTVFETYGMTETVSHIAVKQLNNYAVLGENITKQSFNNCFKTLPNIAITQDERDCLVVNAPKVSSEEVITNDIVKLHSSTTFEWLGRFDNIINSGGIKIAPEQVENVLSSEIENRFFIASEEDDTLGERVILIIEGNESPFNVSIFNDLEPFSKPKKIYYLPQFVETPSGKIQRKKTLQLIK